MAKSNLVTKTSFDNEVSRIDRKIAKIKQKMSPLKMNYKKQKNKKNQKNQPWLFHLFFYFIYFIFFPINRFDSEDGTQAYLIFDISTNA